MKVNVVRGTVKYGAKYNEKSKQVEGEKSAGPGDAIDLEDGEAQRLIDLGVASGADSAVAVPATAVSVSEQSTGGVTQSSGGTASLPGV